MVSKRSKRVVKIKFPDGVFTILDIEEDKQTGMIGLWTKRGIFSRAHKVSIPKAAIPDLDNIYILKNKKSYLCCHNYDSLGNPIPDESDPIARVVSKLIHSENEIKFLRNRVLTLEQTNNQLNQTQEQAWNTTIERMAQVTDKVIAPMRRTKEKPVFYGEQIPAEQMPEEG